MSGEFRYLCNMSPLLKKILSKKASRRKVVKKNTTYRKLRAWDKKLDHRLEQRAASAVTVDEAERTCSNCGVAYVGRVCPQCGQVGTWSRYTWKQALLNFLDIWGLGNRPMFRTLRELLTRPGYMVRDYLQGHRQFYFPPFKLLAISIVFLVFVGWLTGIQPESFFSSLTEASFDKIEKSSVTKVMLFKALLGFFKFLSSNLLYEWLFDGVVAVVCVWIAFRRVSRYNLVETYIFLIYVLSLKVITDIPDTLIHWLHYQARDFSQVMNAAGASTPMAYLSTACNWATSLLVFVYKSLALLLIILAFRQFYGLKWKSTVFRLLMSLLVGVVITVFVVSVFSGLVSNHVDDVVYGSIWMTLIVISFWLAAKYINKYQAQCNRLVLAFSKVAMITVLFAPYCGQLLREAKMHIALASPLLALGCVVVVCWSMLPIYLYKKYKNTWISVLPFLALMTAINLVLWS